MPNQSFWPRSQKPQVSELELGGNFRFKRKFSGEMQSVREARVVRCTGSELREGGRDVVGGCGGWRDWGGGGRREEGGGRREEGRRREEGGGRG